MKAVKKSRPKAARPKTLARDLSTMLSSVVAPGGVRLVDLTQTLSPDFPPIVLPPEMGQSRPVRIRTHEPAGMRPCRFSHALRRPTVRRKSASAFASSLQSITQPGAMKCSIGSASIELCGRSRPEIQ